MKLKVFLVTEEISVKEFANIVGTSTPHLYEIMRKGEKRKAGYYLALRIENHTGGKVTLEDLGVCRKKIPKKKKDKLSQLDIFKESKKHEIS